ncbi:MAG: M20/M25/M40 family metallo-hydrolase, partial [Alistipes sp.]|nr:M20/M25/M40 family metallo-hydrolase [Alistipes sp.]
YAVFGVPAKCREAFEERYARFAADIKAEFAITEPDMHLALNPIPAPKNVLSMASQKALVGALVGVPNGVLAMSMAVKGLVETSTNLASVKFDGEDKIVVTTSQRSSLESAKLYAKQAVESVFLLAGATVEHSDGYPGWSPDPKSKLLEITVESYRRLFSAEPRVRAVHAGLECGLFLEKYPHLEMVSFGPTIRGVHSPDERLEISTVDKFWLLLCDVVKNI